MLQDDEYIFDDYDSSLDNSYTIEAQEGKYFITFPTSSDETDDDVNVLEINSENSEDDMNTEVGTDNVAKDLKATAMDCADNSNNESPERTFQHLNASRSNNDNVPENIASIFTCGQQRKINKQLSITLHVCTGVCSILYNILTFPYIHSIKKIT